VTIVQMQLIHIKMVYNFVPYKLYESIVLMCMENACYSAHVWHLVLSLSLPCPVMPTLSSL